MAIDLSTSPNTSLALLPPPEIIDLIQQFRSVYDKAATKWPPHINLFYPFVPQNQIAEALEIFEELYPDTSSIGIRFDRAEAWRFKDYVTIVLLPDENTALELKEMQSVLSERFSGKNKHPFNPHMTLGQSPHEEAKVEILKIKGDMLCEYLGETTWSFAALSRKDGDMLLVKDLAASYDGPISLLDCNEAGNVVPRSTYTFNGEEWETTKDVSEEFPPEVKVATYNVMYDPDFGQNIDRLQASVHNIVSCGADILCLQEVTDEFLQALIGRSEVNSLYHYVTHCESLPTLRHMNTAILSKLPFEWEELIINKRKGVTLAKFALEGNEPLIVCSIHLPAHLTDQSVVNKYAYYQTLDRYIQDKYPASPCIVAGDFNLHTDTTIKFAMQSNMISSEMEDFYGKLFPEDRYLDVWTVAGEEEGVSDCPGATFDPFANKLAKFGVEEFSRLPLSKQRFDRILIRLNDSGHDHINIREARLFGFASESGCVGSDHWGVLAAVQVKHEADEQKTEEPLDIMDAPFSDQDVRDLVIQQGLMPTQEDKKLRDRVVYALTRCLEGYAQDETDLREGSFKMMLRPVGSFAMGTYDNNSDIDCLVVGNITTKIFWKVARQRIRRWGGVDVQHLGIKVVRFVDAQIPMLILLVGGVRVDLQYCTAVRLVEEWQTRPNLPPTDPQYNLPVTTLKKLGPLRDMDHILSILPHQPNFRQAYRFVKLWAIRRGIYAAKFGYLGGIHITLLLTRVCVLLPASATVPQIIRVFFNQYANWDWKESVTCPILPRKILYQRATREAMAILTVSPPTINVATNASKHTVNTMQREFQRAEDKLATSGFSGWTDLLGENWESSDKAGLSEFLTGYNSYVKVDLQFWGQVKANGRALVGYVESRIVMLLVSLADKVPSLNAHVWPKRFHEVSAATNSKGGEKEGGGGEKDDDEEEKEVYDELRGFYLIGLTSSLPPASKDDRKLAESKFLETLRTFEAQISATQDETTTFIRVSCIRQSELSPQPSSDQSIIIKLDDSGIWDGNVGEEESAGVGGSFDIDSEEEDDDDELSQVAASLLISPAARRVQLHTPKGPTPKLRPSVDVYNRIMWDNSYESSEYLIGYEDRFKGVMEMDVVNWKTEMSDDEFVPFHRVVWFRKKDGEKVWDRSTKIDLVFGSGVSK